MFCSYVLGGFRSTTFPRCPGLPSARTGARGGSSSKETVSSPSGCISPPQTGHFSEYVFLLVSKTQTSILDYSPICINIAEKTSAQDFFKLSDIKSSIYIYDLA